jgi:Cu/Ag efflux protein CusF
MTFKTIIPTLTGILALAACSDADEATAPEQAPVTTAGTEHRGHDTTSDTGHARGVIVSVAEGELGIDHGPINGIGMGAMTMVFGTMGDVEATDFERGDDVSFMVKRGRDGSYRVMAICDTDENGSDCLDGITRRDR